MKKLLRYLSFETVKFLLDDKDMIGEWSLGFISIEFVEKIVNEMKLIVPILDLQII